MSNREYFAEEAMTAIGLHTIYVHSAEMSVVFFTGNCISDGWVWSWKTSVPHCSALPCGFSPPPVAKQHQMSNFKAHSGSKRHKPHKELCSLKVLCKQLMAVTSLKCKSSSCLELFSQNKEENHWCLEYISLCWEAAAGTSHFLFDWSALHGNCKGRTSG